MEIIVSKKLMPKVSMNKKLVLKFMNIKEINVIKNEIKEKTMRESFKNVRASFNLL